MPNNFKLTGDIYVSKDGSDADTGLTPDLPKKTLTGALAIAALGNTIVVGAGYYQEAVTTNISTLTMLADGKVKVVNPGGGDFDFRSNTSVFSGDWSIIGYNGVNEVEASSNITFNNTCFQDVEFGSNSTTVIAVNCKFVNCNNVANTKTFKISRSILINSNLGKTTSNTNELIDSYVDATSTFFNLTALTAVDFTNNCITGVVAFAGTDYALYQEKDGSAVSPVPSELDIIAVVPDIYTTRASFNQNPDFFNISKGEFYSVNAASPLLRAGLTNNNIAGVQTGALFAVGDANFYPGSFTEDVTLLLGDVIYNGADGEGEFITEALEVSNQAEVIELFPMAALFAYDSDDVIGSITNKNVPAVENYATATAGANPRRLVFECRWSVAVTAPVLSAEWENDNLVTAGNYSRFEVDAKPLIDGNGVTSGYPNYVEDVGNSQIRMRWVQFRIVVQEGLG